jgi:hypothetical protein
MWRNVGRLALVLSASVRSASVWSGGGKGGQGGWVAMPGTPPACVVAHHALDHLQRDDGKRAPEEQRQQAAATKSVHGVPNAVAKAWQGGEGRGSVLRAAQAVRR